MVMGFETLTSKVCELKVWEMTVCQVVSCHVEISLPKSGRAHWKPRGTCRTFTISVWDKTKRRAPRFCLARASLLSLAWSMHTMHTYCMNAGKHTFRLWSFFVSFFFFMFVIVCFLKGYLALQGNMHFRAAQLKLLARKRLGTRWAKYLFRRSRMVTSQPGSETPTDSA